MEGKQGLKQSLKPIHHFLDNTITKITYTFRKIIQMPISSLFNIYNNHHNHLHNHLSTYMYIIPSTKADE